MLGWNTDTSIKFYEIYGKFKRYLFSEWAQHKNVEKAQHEQSDDELENNLRAFYAEARNKEGKEYGKLTLLCPRGGIERYLPSLQPRFKVLSNSSVQKLKHDAE